MKVKFDIKKFFSLVDEYKDVFNIENKPSVLTEFWLKAEGIINNRDIQVEEEDIISKIVDANINHQLVKIEGYDKLIEDLKISFQQNSKALFEKRTEENLLLMNMFSKIQEIEQAIKSLNENELFNILVKQEELLLEKRINELID